MGEAIACRIRADRKHFHLKRFYHLCSCGANRSGGYRGRLGEQPEPPGYGPTRLESSVYFACFPIAMARGATWDPDLEERIGDAIGVEARSQGANFFGGVCINLLRHPAWGRAQETYGEDPHHLGEMGAALVRGAQRHVMACVKHFAANSMENARFKVDVRIGERALREIYLPHFKRCIDEGAASVMSAYNKVNGDYCGHNRRLLTDILKNEWGFSGFVISDFLLGIRDTVAAAEGGMDIEMPFTWHFGRRLLRQVRKGRVKEERIDDAVLRIMRQKIRFSKIGDPARYGRHAVACDAHKRLAREAAVKSIVLLKNDPARDQNKPILPIDATKVTTIAVIGKLAHVKNIGDSGSSMVRPPYVITALEGIRAAVPPEIKIIHHKGGNVNAAAHIAESADVVIIVVGYTHRQEDEYIPIPPKGGDRDFLTLTRRVRLEPGETCEVEFTLSADQLARYDEKQAKWVVDAMGYNIYVGSSSARRDLLCARCSVIPLPH